jgi:hypothetical protein
MIQLFSIVVSEKEYMTVCASLNVCHILIKCEPQLRKKHSFWVSYAICTITSIVNASGRDTKIRIVMSALVLLRASMRYYCAPFQGCQIVLGTTYQKRGKNIANYHKMYQMSIDFTKWL